MKHWCLVLLCAGVLAGCRRTTQEKPPPPQSRTAEAESSAADRTETSPPKPIVAASESSAADEEGISPGRSTDAALESSAVDLEPAGAEPPSIEPGAADVPTRRAESGEVVLLVEEDHVEPVVATRRNGDATAAGWVPLFFSPAGIPAPKVEGLTITESPDGISIRSDGKHGPRYVACSTPLRGDFDVSLELETPAVTPTFLGLYHPDHHPSVEHFPLQVRRDRPITWRISIKRTGYVATVDDGWRPPASARHQGGVKTFWAPDSAPRLFVCIDGPGTMKVKEFRATSYEEAGRRNEGVKQPAVRMRLRSDETVVRLPASVTDLDVGGAGRFLAMYFRELRKVGVFDVVQGRFLHAIPAEDPAVRIAAGRTQLVIAGVIGRKLQCWDLATGRPGIVRSLEAGQVVHNVALGAGSDSPIMVWMSPGTFAAADRERIRFWATQSGKEQAPFKPNDRDITTACASPDGSLLAVFGTHGAYSRLAGFSCPQRKTVFSLSNESRIDDIAVSPDGKFLATGGQSSQGIRLRQADTGAVIRTFPGSRRSRGGLAFSSDGRLLVIASADYDRQRQRWPVLVVNVPNGESATVLGDHKSLVNSVAISTDSRLLVTADSVGQIRVFQRESGELVREFTLEPVVARPEVRRP